MPRKTFESPFDLGERVRLGGDAGFSVIIQTIVFRAENPEAEVTWLSDHQVRTAWVPIWRLGPVDGDVSGA